MARKVPKPADSGVPGAALRSGWCGGPVEVGGHTIEAHVDIPPGHGGVRGNIPQAVEVRKYGSRPERKPQPVSPLRKQLRSRHFAPARAEAS